MNVKFPLYSKNRKNKVALDNGILFIQIVSLLAKQKRTHYFYMHIDGTRFVSLYEIENGCLPTKVEWKKSVERYGVKSLTENELQKAQYLLLELLNNFYFGMTVEQQNSIIQEREKTRKILQGYSSAISQNIKENSS